MTGEARFAKPRLSRRRARAPAAPPRHACARSSGRRSARRRRGTPRPAPAPVRFPPRVGAKARWQGAIWLGWIRLLPSNPSAPPLPAFAHEAVGIVEAVEHAVEHRNARCARREHDHLQRGRDRLARCIERQPQVGAKVVGAGDQARAHSLAICAAARTPAAVSIIASTGLLTASATPLHQMRRDGARNDDQVRARSRDGIEVERMPFGPNAVHPDRDRHRPLHARPRRPRLARRVLSAGFTASSRSRTTRSAPASRALAIARGLDAGRNSSDRTANRSSAHVAFRFHYGPRRRIIRRSRSAGKKHADQLHDCHRRPCAPVRDDGRQDRPPGLSLHHRAFRPLHPGRGARASTSSRRFSTASAARST